MKSMKKILFVAVALMAMSTTNVSAETTQSNDVYLSTIYVNEQVTTHLIMPETIRLVDISTDTIVGNQVNDNIVSPSISLSIAAACHLPAPASLFRIGICRNTRILM